MSGGEQADQKPEVRQKGPSQKAEELRSALQEIQHESMNRLGAVEGLSEVRAGRVGAGEKFRFLVTAAVQRHPGEIGTWLNGDGAGFRAADRPVNTSLIDQDHNWTFEGNNGYILEPPVNPDDIIAARPHDFASNDMSVQPIDHNAQELLEATNPQGYNQINIRSGKLAGVFIKLTPEGTELGDPVKNQQLRAFAEERGLPIVELEVKPQDLHAGEPTMERLPANDGNELWKIKIPGEGKLQELDIIQFQSGERPEGFRTDEAGFDMRLRDIDGYGQSEDALAVSESVRLVLAKLDQLASSVDAEDKPALEFARRRLQQAIQG